jgi:hypothetical protein|tara:strand:+ start:71 stop:331 length:261 start_codon:yes stop_codon:yes gene_type:complete
MKIELGYYDMVEALEAYIEKKYNLKLNIDETETEFKHRKDIYKPLRYKNGKVKYCPVNGYALRTLDRWETKYVVFNENCEVAFYLE